MIIKAYNNNKQIAKLETNDEDIAFHAALAFLETCPKITFGEHCAEEDDFYGVPGFKVDGVSVTAAEVDQAISLYWFN